MRLIRCLLATTALALVVVAAGVTAPVAFSGTEYVACDGTDLEPNAYVSTSYSTTTMSAHIDPGAILTGTGASGDYYESYLRLYDQSLSRYIEIYVRRALGDQGSYTVGARSFDGASGHQGSEYTITSGPDVQLRYNSGDGLWEAYDGSHVLETALLSLSGSQQRQFGTFVHIGSISCPSFTSTFTSVTPGPSGLTASNLTYVDSLPYHATNISSTSLKFSGPS